MVLSISGIVLLGILVLIFFRKDNLKVSHALVCGLLGFYLAGTSMAPGIRSGGEGLAAFLGGIQL